MITLTVNGAAHRVEVPPRTHLADALRDHCGLTGTHLGCEQGVCGACTVLLDGAPVRACLISAHEAARHAVTSIEGLDNDPLAARLRAAFTRHHALQCGFCTPGMLITARDIVLRLGAVDEARIREELAGNLCRCTGYRGIVRAIAEVAAEGPARAEPARQDSPRVATLATVTAPSEALTDIAGDLPHRLEQELLLAMPPGVAWLVLSDPERLVACVPGARLLARDGERLSAEIAVGIGPFTARFRGEGRIILDADRLGGRLLGQGRDGGTAARGEVSFRLSDAPGGTRLQIALAWRLTGPLAQFARPALLRGAVSKIAAETARRIEAEARGGPRMTRQTLIGRLGRWLAALFGNR